MKYLVFGSLNIDRTYTVPHFVEAGETMSAAKMELFCGGKGFNQAVALARAGKEVYFAGAVGNDGGMLLEALADGAVASGIPREKALNYAAMTMVGAAEMYLETHIHPGALKDAVCSPGGSTIQGVRALEEHGFRSAVMEAIIAAWEKNRILGK